MDGSEMDSTDVIRVGKPESSLGLAVSDLPGDFRDVLIKGTRDVVVVAKYEGF